MSVGTLPLTHSLPRPQNAARLPHSQHRALAASALQQHQQQQVCNSNLLTGVSGRKQDAQVSAGNAATQQHRSCWVVFDIPLLEQCCRAYSNGQASSSLQAMSGTEPLTLLRCLWPQYTC